MSPRFAHAIDPIFTCVLDLIDRIDSGKSCDPAEEKARIVKQFNAANGQLGGSPEWMEFARYALYSWIDSELARVHHWDGREWWHANSLELDYHGQTLANVMFFRQAVEAARLPSKDALEVFYVCVILGFRGFYENVPEADKQQIIEGFGLPRDVKSWVAQYASAVRQARDLPPITDARGPADVAQPRNGKHDLLYAAMLTAIAVSVVGSFVFAAFLGRS